jgi:hypothetical protein
MRSGEKIIIKVMKLDFKNSLLSRLTFTKLKVRRNAIAMALICAQSSKALFKFKDSEFLI